MARASPESTTACCCGLSSMPCASSTRSSARSGWPGAQPRHHVQVRQHQRLGLGAGGRDGGVDGHERRGFGGQVARPELRAVDGERLLGALTRRSGGRTRTAAPWRRPGAPSTATSRAARAAARWPRPASPSERSSGPTGFGRATRPCTPVALISAATSSRYCGKFSMSRVVAARGAAQRHRGDGVGAGRAADAEVDAAGRRGLQQRELLGDRQRRVVGQHHPARTEPQLLGLRGEVGDHHRRAGRGDGGHVVVLGHPVAGVAQLVGGLRQTAPSRPARPRWSGRCGRGRGRVPRVARLFNRSPAAIVPRPRDSCGVAAVSAVITARITGRRCFGGREDVVEHRRGEPAGERVLLAGVIAADQRRPRRACAIAPGDRTSAAARRTVPPPGAHHVQRHPPREPAERDDHPHIAAGPAATRRPATARRSSAPPGSARCPAERTAPRPPCECR